VEPFEFCNLVAARRGWAFPSDRVRDRLYSQLLVHTLNVSATSIARWKCLRERSVIPPEYKNYLGAIAGLMEAESALLKIGLDRQSLQELYELHQPPTPGQPSEATPLESEQLPTKRFRPHRYRF
jgi:hypothetical protein